MVRFVCWWELGSVLTDHSCLVHFVTAVQKQGGETSPRSRCSFIFAAVWTWPTWRTPALRSDLWLPPELWEGTFATSDRMRNANIQKNLDKWSLPCLSLGGWGTAAAGPHDWDGRQLLLLEKFCLVQLLHLFYHFRNTQVCHAVYKENRSFAQKSVWM